MATIGVRFSKFRMVRSASRLILRWKDSDVYRAPRRDLEKTYVVNRKVLYSNILRRKYDLALRMFVEPLQ